MLNRLRETLIQNNRVLPIVLAGLVVLVLALVVFWFVLGGEESSEQAADQEIATQAQGESDTEDSISPEVENRNVDSYAAFEAKDPFRQIVEPADSGDGGGGDTSGGDGGSGDGSGGDTSGSGDNGTGGGDNSGGGGGGRSGQDSDGDGLSDRRENRLNQDPANPDTDGDGIQDGADDSNGDGRPDGRNGGSGGGNGDDGLFDSGGSSLPGGN